MNKCYYFLVLLYSFNSLHAQTITTSSTGQDSTKISPITHTTSNSSGNTIIPSANSEGNVQDRAFFVKRFHSSLVNGKAMIQWQTVREGDNDYFDLQHSSNGRDFISIARMKGNNNLKSEQNYTFEHENLGAGKHYYRLIQIDKSGEKFSSQIIALSSISLSRLQLYPNPSSGHITVSASSLLQGSQYSINSLSGQVLLQGTFKDQHIDIQKLQPGQYWIIVKTTSGELLKANFLKR